MVALSKNCSDHCYVVCNVCGIDHIIFYNRHDMLNWLSGTLPIQDALNYLSAGERELLLSGVCGKCFDMMFPPLDNAE